MSQNESTDPPDILDEILDEINEEAAKPNTSASKVAAGNGDAKVFSTTGDSDDVRKILAVLSPARSDDYSDWLAVGMALHSEGRNLLSVWDNWSRQSTRWKEGACAEKWKSFRRDSNGVGMGTLVKWARQDSGKPEIGNGNLIHECSKNENGLTGWPLIEDAADVMANPLDRPHELIESIVFAESKISLSGPSKSYKTFFQMYLAVCIALGIPWLGRKTQQGRVLYVNLELRPFSFQMRLRAIVERLGTEFPKDIFHQWHLRGYMATIEQLEIEFRRKVESEHYALIVLDPLYKILGPRSENDASAMGDLLNRIEAIAHQAGSAILIAHHFAKGNAAAKLAMDRSSGSGVIARDGDCLLSLTPHQEDDCFTLDCILRDFPPIDPLVLRFAYPAFEVDNALDPAKLKTQPNNTNATPISEQDVLNSVTGEPQTRDDIEKAIRLKTRRGQKAVASAFLAVLNAGKLKHDSLKRPGTRDLKRYWK